MNYKFLKNKTLSLTIIALMVSVSLLGQDYKLSPQNIRGVITHQGMALANVNITIDGHNIDQKTNTDGFYNLKANIGSIIEYSYDGLKTVLIIVEDVTNVLNIKMVIQEEELEAVLVITQKKALDSILKGNKSFKTASGVFNPKASGFRTIFIEGDRINFGYTSLTEALRGKFAGYRIIGGKPFLRGAGGSITQLKPAIWDIDGLIVFDDPLLDLSQIKDIHVINAAQASTRYGNLGAGGVIIVRTKYRDFGKPEVRKAKIEEITALFTNKNFYNNDAVALNKNLLFTNAYTNTIKSFADNQKAIEYYNQTLKNKIHNVDEHLIIAQNFSSFYNDDIMASEILKGQATKHYGNPEILKAIAYQMQMMGFKKEALKTYKTIFKLRPKYAQSYRDLANAYRENGLYNKAWRLYMGYLVQGNKVDGNGIGELIYSEMEWLYFNKGNQVASKLKFIPKNENRNAFSNDVRFVFEWNTSEAEFNLEFVNQKKQAFVFEHSLDKNQKLIIDEKQKGYSSKAFIIDDLGTATAEWLVNLSYFGNKKSMPTYLKVTTYYHWGKPNQIEKTMVYKLQKEETKIQLLKFNKQALLALN